MSENSYQQTRTPRAHRQTSTKRRTWLFIEKKSPKKKITFENKKRSREQPSTCFSFCDEKMEWKSNDHKRNPHERQVKTQILVTTRNGKRWFSMKNKEMILQSNKPNRISSLFFFQRVWLTLRTHSSVLLCCLLGLIRSFGGGALSTTSHYLSAKSSNIGQHAWIIG